MTGPQRERAARVLAILRRESGLTDQGLAGRLGVDLGELVPVLRVLYRQGKVDRCWSYTVLSPRSALAAKRAAA